MSAEQPRQNAAYHTPQDLQSHEPALINLYRELTGDNEAHARSVLMFVIADNEELRSPQ